MINEKRAVCEAASVLPDRIVLGISWDHLVLKRIWVDGNLTDQECLFFLRNHFKGKEHDLMDYERIKVDQNRVLLHVYFFTKTALSHFLKNHLLCQSRLACVETTLHGLGRALSEYYQLHRACFQCLSIFLHGVLLSVHGPEVVLYAQFEPYHHSNDFLSAVHRLLFRYELDEHYFMATHFFYLNFGGHQYVTSTPETHSQFLNVVSKEQLIQLEQECFFKSISFDAHTIIPYGLALRGLL